jgi:hypothetical protein
MHRLLAVIAVLGLMSSAMAADLPKEGTFKGTFTDVGTYKTIKIGDRMLVIFDETGAQVTSGLADHTTSHCWGTTEVANSEASSEGHCGGIDPIGDLIEVKFTIEKHRVLVGFATSAAVLSPPGQGSRLGVRVPWSTRQP